MDWDINNHSPFLLSFNPSIVNPHSENLQIKACVINKFDLSLGFILLLEDFLVMDRRAYPNNF